MYIHSYFIRASLSQLQPHPQQHQSSFLKSDKYISTKKRITHRTYKLLMADNSQVCVDVIDGRSVQPTMDNSAYACDERADSSFKGYLLDTRQDEQIAKGSNTNLANPTYLSRSPSDSELLNDRKPTSSIRLKCKPQHRKMSLNESLTSIMKPSRYSQDKHCQLERRHTIGHTIDTCDDSTRSTDSWVPLGVEFSKTSEICVYK